MYGVYIIVHVHIIVHVRTYKRYTRNILWCSYSNIAKL